ncbi:hypothetical protein Tco_0660954 [Tanacetum coccineum]
MADDVAATSAMMWHVGPTSDTVAVYEVRGSLYEPMIGAEAMIGWQRLSTRLSMWFGDPRQSSMVLEGYVSALSWLKME